MRSRIFFAGRAQILAGQGTRRGGGPAGRYRHELWRRVRRPGECGEEQTGQRRSREYGHQAFVYCTVSLGSVRSGGKVGYTRIPFSENDSAAHRALGLETARKSMVLLKNTNHVLPLASGVKTLAVIGPNAASLAALEGNYNAVPSRPVLPLDGIEQDFAGRARILYAQCSPYANGVSLAGAQSCVSSIERESGGGFNGLRTSLVSDFGGKPLLRRIDRQVDFDWNSASPGAEFAGQRFPRALGGHNHCGEARRLRVRHQMGTLFSVLEPGSLCRVPGWQASRGGSYRRKQNVASEHE